MMDDERLQQHTAWKAAAVDKLSTSLPGWLETYRAQLDATDERIVAYIAAVAADTDSHNLYELLAIVRFFRLLETRQWAAKRVTDFIFFYERLKFNGLRGRQRYKLTPIQVFQYANIFGFLDGSGHRLCRNAYIFVPRKFSKTTSSASLAVYDMLFGDNNAQVYIGANSYDQAKICFNEIRAIMFDIDPGQKFFRVNREKITFKARGRDSLIQCLTANARTKDGLFASLVIMDEYAQARDTGSKGGADLKNVLESSMGPRPEPLSLVITTASDVIDGPFAHELDGVKAVLRGEVENDRIFASIFEPDAGDDIADPRTWHKVQPHIGITITEDFYPTEYRKALLSAENMLSFKTRLLNIFAENETRSWISSKLAWSVARPMDLKSVKGRPDAMVAIDLSESGDFSAVSIGVYNPDGQRYAFHTAYFFPEGALSGHPNEVLYRRWADDGHLILTKGQVIDYSVIVAYVLEMNRYVRQLAIGYDPWKSHECVNMLAAAGAKNVLKEIRQTFGYFTAPVESFEHGIKTGHIVINNNPINMYCFGNAVLGEDHLENVKPIKRSQADKIDGVITMLMCMRLFIDYER